MRKYCTSPAVRRAYPWAFGGSSSSGGGTNADRQTTNPAWDFQYLVLRYELKSEYRFCVRLAYHPRCSRVEIVQECSVAQNVEMSFVGNDCVYVRHSHVFCERQKQSQFLPATLE